MLSVDASQYSVIVVSQLDNLPVAYISEVLTEVQVRSTQIKKNVMVLVVRDSISLLMEGK